MRLRPLGLALLPLFSQPVAADGDARWTMEAMPRGICKAIEAAVPGARSMKPYRILGFGGITDYGFRGSDAEDRPVEVSLSTPGYKCWVATTIPCGDVPADVMDLARIAWPDGDVPFARIQRITNHSDRIGYTFSRSNQEVLEGLEPVFTIDSRGIVTLFGPVSKQKPASPWGGRDPVAGNPSFAARIGAYPPDVQQAIRLAVPGCRSVDGAGLQVGTGAADHQTLRGLDAKGRSFRLSLIREGGSPLSWRCTIIVGRDDLPAHIRKAAWQVAEAKGWNFAEIRRVSSDEGFSPTYEFSKEGETSQAGSMSTACLSMVNLSERN